MITFEPIPANKDGRLQITVPGASCVLLFRHPSLDEVDEDQWRAAFIDKCADPVAAIAALNRSRRQTVFIGWEGIVDPQGEAIPFSQSSLVALMLRMPDIEVCVLNKIRELFDLDTVLGEPTPPAVLGTAAVESLNTGVTTSSTSTTELPGRASAGTSE